MDFKLFGCPAGTPSELPGLLGDYFFTSRYQHIFGLELGGGMARVFSNFVSKIVFKTNVENGHCAFEVVGFT